MSPKNSPESQKKSSPQEPLSAPAAGEQGMPIHPYAAAPMSGVSPPAGYGSAAAVPPSYAPPPRRPIPGFTKRDGVFAVLSGVLGFLLVRYALWFPQGYITTAVMLLLTGVEVLYLRGSGASFSVGNLLNVAVMAALSVVFSITSDNPIKFLTMLFILGAGAYLALAVGTGRKRVDRQFALDLAHALFLPFSGMGYEVKALGTLSRKDANNRNLLYILLGLLAAVPLTAIVWSLLTSADAAMSNFMKEIFKDINIEFGPLLIQVILCVPVAMYVFAVLAVNAKGARRDALTPEAYAGKFAEGRVFPNVAAYTVVTPVLILYVIFFFTQLPYFTSGFSGALPAGYSFSEYAVSGFSELVVLAILNFGMILVLTRLTRNSGDKGTPTLRIYTVLLSLSTLVLVASSISKMAMYVLEYGMSRRRFLATWFMALVALTFMLIIIQQFASRLALMRLCVITATVMFCALAFCRVDRQIARVNIAMRDAGILEELDAKYIVTQLNDDACLYLLEHDGGETRFELYNREWTVNEYLKTSSFQFDGDNTPVSNRYRYYNTQTAKLYRFLFEKK